MSGILRIAGRAFLVATVVALAVDGVLAALASLVSLTGSAGAAPWWVAAHLVERGRWVVVALLLAAAGGRVTVGADTAPPDAAAIWRAVGGMAMAAPLVWIAATWIVQATLYTVADRWDIDGQVFLASGYYQRLLADYAPWLLGGATTLVASRHVR